MRHFSLIRFFAVSSFASSSECTAAVHPVRAAAAAPTTESVQHVVPRRVRRLQKGLKAAEQCDATDRDGEVRSTHRRRRQPARCNRSVHHHLSDVLSDTGRRQQSKDERLKKSSIRSNETPIKKPTFLGSAQRWDIYLVFSNWEQEAH
jgi:hypothetical protein